MEYLFLLLQARNFFEDELIALRDQNKAHAEVLEEDASMDITGGLFAGRWENVVLESLAME